MNDIDIHQPGAAVWRSRRVVFALVVILAGGALLTWWTVKHADQYMRADLLFQTRLVAEALNPARVQALLGTEADMDSPDYLRLKDQLASAKTVTDFLHGCNQPAAQYVLCLQVGLHGFPYFSFYFIFVAVDDGCLDGFDQIFHCLHLCFDKIPGIVTPCLFFLMIW